MSARWEGYTPRECGEHRTTGQRAWCFDCQEWCSLGLPCRGCEIGPLLDVARAAMRIDIDLAAQCLYEAAERGRADRAGEELMEALNALHVALRSIRGPL